ncbi:thiamine pyrophosphate-dependent enzyme, partial [Muricomes intestini]
MNQIDNLSINAIRILSADAIQKANSGHPGLPLGCASVAYELWARHMNHNPAAPDWLNRDRFVLSGGHGSMLLYSLLYLYGYGDLTLEDLKEFRQLNSKTPGHPEYGHTVGVEATTGPLGAGMGMAVGMAIAERHLSAVFNKESYPVIDHYTFALGGDGCMMEGISSEAFSLAGTLGLSKLIILYDSNNISIEGSTKLAFTEDVEMRMKAFGFQTLAVEDGNDIEAIGNAIERAKADKEHPSFIKIHTEIGYGCPNKQGKASAHGEPLGEDNVRALRENLQWPSQEPFYIPDEVYENYRALRESLIQRAGKWEEMFEEYCRKYPEMKELIDVYFNDDSIKLLENNIEFWKRGKKPEATRNISGQLLNMMKEIIPNLIGGSAD